MSSSDKKPRSLRSLYAVDPASNEDGMWQDLKGGIRVKLRYENSATVQEGARQVDKKYRALIMTDGGLSADLQAERDARVLSEYAITDWSGIVDETGAPIPFSVRAAYDIMIDPEMGDFRRDVLYAARVGENYRRVEQEKLTKN